MKRYVIGIRGQRIDPDFPVDIWFDSLKSVSSILSAENMELLKIIDKNKPNTISELSEMTGRARGNLSRTLKTLASKKIVSLTTINNKTKADILAKNYIIMINE